MRKRIKKGNLFSRFSVTLWLIIINIALFFVFYPFLLSKNGLIGTIAIIPANIFAGSALWTFITSMFAHAGPFHLFVNMFTLFFLGSFSEKIIGRRRFLWLFLIAGIVGSVAYVLFAKFGSFFSFGENVFGGMNMPAVGASGALFGLLGLLAVLVPWHSVYLIAGPLLIIILQFIIGPFLSGSVGSVFYFATTAMIFAMIFAMFSPNPKFRKISVPVRMPLWIAPIVAIIPLVIISFFVKLPIGNTAHFGGLLVGLGYGFYLRRKYKRKITMLQRYIR